jgi:hypothetical protein
MHIDTRSSIVVIEGIGSERELCESAPREGQVCTSGSCPPQKLHQAGASLVLGSAISSCKMWRVQAHMFVLVFSHRTRCRKLVSSRATRPVSGARCQTATFDAWRPHRYGLAFQVHPLAGSPRHCQAGDVYQMASNCFSSVLEMEVSEIRPTTASGLTADGRQISQATRAAKLWKQGPALGFLCSQSSQRDCRL